MKIPFDLDSWIADKSQKVVTRDGKPVRIICTDCKAGQPIVALVTCTYEGGSTYESVESYSENGFYFAIGNKDADLDLFLVTDEPELTEFEQNVRSCIVTHLTTRTKTADGGEISSTVFFSDATAREIAKELLALARKQIEKEVYGSIQAEMDKHRQRLEDTFNGKEALDYYIKIEKEN